VGAEPDHELFHILYDGTVMDESDWAVLGGEAERINEMLKSEFSQGLALGDALQLGARALGNDEGALGAEELEVALLDQTREHRAFRRFEAPELGSLLSP
jgi:proteasome alpha subunit